MKATFVLLADLKSENLAKKVMLEAHGISGVGFEATRLPSHISLKQPFDIENLEDIELYFDSFAKTIKPIEVELTEIEHLRSNVFGYESGLLWFDAKETPELRNIHNRLNKELEEKFGNSEAQFDGADYHFHMTISIGGGTHDDYVEAFNKLSKKIYNEKFVFDELGLLYYDENDIRPGTYFCYKRAKL